MARYGMSGLPSAQLPFPCFQIFLQWTFIVYNVALNGDFVKKQHFPLVRSKRNAFHFTLVSIAALQE
jgi:hypothetical protein